MWSKKLVCLAAVTGTAGLLAAHSSAELQQVEVGGSILVMGEYYRHVASPAAGLRWPANWLTGRAVGNGPDISSGFGWDDDGPGMSLVSQWTRLHVNAHFTGEVNAFIEVDSMDTWGEDFRSGYVTGLDARAGSMDDIEIHQAYIETERLFGTPLRLRVGRQELRFGSEWLVGGNDDGPAPAWGLSFDAVRLTWAAEAFTVDAWSAKLAERSAVESDGDTDFYGLYASYHGFENLVLDAYWLFLRDAAAIRGPEQGSAGEWLEAVAGVEDYDTTQLHTAGLRAAGEYGAFDFEAEAAYQFGNAGTTGTLFRPVLYGDPDAEYDAWGCNIQLGYSFEAAWRPRVYLAYAFLEGQDERDITFAHWLDALFNPFHTEEASVSFNRLFSNWSYSAILDGSEMSNAHMFHVGVEAAPTENIELGVDVGYYLADEVFERPVMPLLAFWSRPGSDVLGWEVDLNVTYHYSEDLYFCVGWDHLFVGDGLEDGSFTVANGLEFNGGSAGEDADYWYFETGLEF